MSVIIEMKEAATGIEPMNKGFADRENPFASISLT